MATVLVTGASGYIGSHACLELLRAGYDVVGLDNLDNSNAVAIDRVTELAQRSMEFHPVDLRDRAALDSVFAAHDVDAVMHFAGLKAVGESVADPLRYYDVNVGGSLSLFAAMASHDVNRLVFSSSCTVYGSPAMHRMPLTEDGPLEAVSPYGATKLLVETILKDLCDADPAWSVLSLRYFNPIGADESGMIGEDPRGIPNNLLPYVMQVAVGVRDEVQVFGGDYPTPDGTCIRDYIHVVDLVRGHVAALDKAAEQNGFDAINLGTGLGSSVMEVISAAERAVGSSIPHKIVDRRSGDATAVFADPAYALERLGWKAELDLDRMCVDHWRWQQRNPRGYHSP